MNGLRKSVPFLPTRTHIALIYRQNSTLPFKIPERIERSPTDLLRALADTVGPDPTAPHYAFIDDPITIPTSNHKRTTYYLSKEYGKRAARQLVEEWPTLFMFDRDQPRLSAFRPEKPLDPTVVEANEENLQKIIKTKHVEDAITLYNSCQEKNVEISKDTQLDLFRLVAYYNAKNVPLNEIEEWHGARTIFGEPEELLKERQKDGFVETLFESLEKSEEVYSIMICHLCKFYTENIIPDVKNLFVEMLQNGYTPSVQVFNSIFRFPVDHFDFLRKMNQLGVKPTVRTFNTAIQAFLHKEKKQRMDLCRKIISEMKLCKVNPDLVTFNSLIRTIGNFDKMNENIHIYDALNVTNEILNILERWPEIPMGDYNSPLFFSTAMNVAMAAGNLNLAERLYKLYTSQKNHVQLNPFNAESTFYFYYVNLKAPYLTMPELYELYINHFPRVLSFSKNMMTMFINTLKKDPYWPLARRLFEDCIADGLQINKTYLHNWFDFWEVYPFHTLSEIEMDEFKVIFRRLISVYLSLNLNPKMEDKYPVDFYLSKVPFMKEDPEILGILDSFNQALEIQK